MKEKRKYDIDGLTLEIPLYYDEQAKMYIEDYPDFIENPLWTPKGHRVLFSGTDACHFAEEAETGGCPDCGSCKYYERAAEHTLIGICKNEYKKKGK